MVQQLPGISVVKSPCAAWEGRLGKDSGGFCAGQAGGEQELPGELRGGHGSGSLARSSASCSRPSWQGLSASGHLPWALSISTPCFFPQGKWLNAKCVYVKILPKAVSLKTGHLPFSSAAAMSGAGLCGAMGRGAPSPAPRARGGMRSSRSHDCPCPERGRAPSPMPPGCRGLGVTVAAPWCVYFRKADRALGGWRRRQCQFLYSLQPRIQIKSLQACLELLKMPFRTCHLYCLTSAPLHHG